MFDQCWTNVVDGGPTLVKQWVDVSCFPGSSVQCDHSSNVSLIDGLPNAVGQMVDSAD